MANDVIIATVPAIEVNSAPVEVAEVSAVEEAAESPAPVDVAEVESEVAEAPAEVEGDAESEFVAPNALDFKVDGDVLKGALLPLLAMRKTLQHDKHESAVEVIANDDGLTLQTVGLGFAAQANFHVGQGYLPCSEYCRFVLNYTAAEFIAKQFDGDKLYDVVKSGRRISFYDNDGAHCDFNDQSEFFGVSFVLNAPNFTMSQSALAEALSRVLYATAKDLCSALSTVNFSAQNGTLTLCATDGKRLATSTASAEATADFSGNYPARVLQALKPLLANKGSVEFYDNFITVNNWVFKFNRLGNFPAIDKILNEENKATVSFNVKDMLGAVNFVAPATNGNKTISLEFADGHVTITTKSNGQIKAGMFVCDDVPSTPFDAVAQVSRPAELKGDAQNVRFAINANYLLDVLKSLPREISTIALGIKNKSVSIQIKSYQAVVATFTPTSISKKLLIAPPAVKPEFAVANMPESVKIA